MRLVALCTLGIAILMATDHLDLVWPVVGWAIERLHPMLERLLVSVGLDSVF